MRIILTISLFFTFGITQSLFGQTSMRVYEIMQEKCAGCHSNADPEAGLDLEGTGATTQLKAINVYNNIYQVTPANDYAINKGYQHVYPGRPDKSFLFRKLNLGLEETISMHADEESSMPPYGSPQLSDLEKEIFRQWILYGAPLTGEAFNEDIVEQFYNGEGQASYPDGPPPAPAADEGFQIKMGPFFLNKDGLNGSELEYFQKYELDLPADVDVDRIDMKFSTYSHHLIIYDFNPGGDSNIPHGLRLNPDHSNIGMVAAVQQPEDIRLPQGTAFMWDNNLVLDLNSHYINYDSETVYQAESYINVYTKPAGTAAQEMKTELYANLNIYIPNDGDEVTHTAPNSFPWLGDIHVWGLMGHTHKYGTGYKIFKRGGPDDGELIYDGACAEGVPDCLNPYFDYQHIPIRFFEPFLPLTMGLSQGVQHTATYVNDGPFAVNFGATSDDEMMVFVVMYTEDTTGVVFTSNKEIPTALDEVKVYPNPAKDQFFVELPFDANAIRFEMYDMLGNKIMGRNINNSSFSVDVKDFTQGMYLYRIEDNTGHFKTGKILLD